MTRLRHRLSTLATTVTLAVGSGLTLAAPAHAAPSITIKSATAASDGHSVMVNLTYTCGANSGVKSISAGLIDYSTNASGAATANPTCDGHSKTINLTLPDQYGTRFYARDFARASASLVDARGFPFEIASDAKELRLK